MSAGRFIVVNVEGWPMLVDTGSRPAASVARFSDDVESHKPQLLADVLNRGDLALYDGLEPF